VVRHGLREFVFALGVGQFSVQQQMAGFQEIAVGGQLFNGVATVEQFAFVAVDVGDGRLTRCGGQETRVVGEHAGLAIQLADVNHVGANIALVDRHVNGVFAIAELESGFVVGEFHGHFLCQSNSKNQVLIKVNSACTSGWASTC
jgi:hypothetical protein